MLKLLKCCVCKQKVETLSDTQQHTSGGLSRVEKSYSNAVQNVLHILPHVSTLFDRPLVWLEAAGPWTPRTVSAYLLLPFLIPSTQC
jgi:hypothetical protein